MTYTQLDLAGEPAPSVPEPKLETDFWSTPEEAWRPIVPHLLEAVDGRGPCHVLEPSVGQGALLNIAVPLKPQRVSTVEIDPENAAACRKDWPVSPVVADFLALDVLHAFPSLALADESNPLCVIMNPPYTKPDKTIGRDFVQKCLDLALPSLGIVCALLPLDWACGVAWGAIHDQHAASLYPLRRRPSFDGDGSGKRPVAWFVWDLLRPHSGWRVIG